MEMKKYKLGDILVNHDRRRIPLSSKVRSGRKGNFRYYGAQGVVDYIDDYIFDGEYVLIAEDGENLRSRNQNVANLVSGQFWVNNHAHIVTTNEKCDLHYFYYAFNFLQIDGYISGSAQPKLSQDSLNRIEMTIPDLQTQKGIASFLFTIDKRIENLRAQNRVLEQTAKTIYDYTFLQCAGHQTTYNKTLNRNIPADWEIDNLYRIADFTNGLTCQKYRPITEKEKLPVIKIREMHDGVTADTEFVRSDIPEKVIVNPGDLLFSWSASLEVMMWNGVKGGLNQHIFKVTPKEYFSLYFVYFQLKDYIGNFKRMAEARKTTMGHITTDHLNQSRIAIPDKETMKRFSSQVTPLFKKQLVNSQQIETLTTQRNTLLPLLMTGQIEV